MAHGIIRGVKRGVVHGPKHNVAVLGGVAPSMAGVTQDSTSLIYTPANSFEWLLTMAAAGIALPGPTNLWLCQEASGNLADTIGTAPLTQTGAGHLYQQAVTGWSRLAATTVDGTSGQKWINTTTAPNPNTTSTLWFGYFRFPAVAPAANRDVVANAGALDSRFTSGGKIQIINGATTTGTANPLGGVHPWLVKHDNTNLQFTGYTDQEKIAGTYAVMGSNPSYMAGGQTALAGDFGYMYLAEFSGASAEMTDAQIKTLLQTLGWTIAW